MSLLISDFKSDIPDATALTNYHCSNFRAAGMLQGHAREPTFLFFTWKLPGQGKDDITYLQVQMLKMGYDLHRFDTGRLLLLFQNPAR